MKNFFSILSLLLLGILFLGGCAGESEPEQEGIFVVWKSPGMKYADQGFLYKEKERLRLEVYSNGQAVLRLIVKPDRVCVAALCLNGKEFNRRFLSAEYPEEILSKILRGEVIFGGAGLMKRAEGFTQSVKKEGRYAIEYSVLNGSIVFRDKINDISIKIQKAGS